MGLSPSLPRCVVRSDPLHCIYILCILRLLCLLEIVNSDGMLSAGIWLQHPGDVCVCVCVKEIVWQVSVTS